MPRIPTIIAEQGIRTGPTGAEASPLAFSDGAQGMDALAQGLQNTSATLEQIAQKKQRDDDNRWLSEASTQYTEEAITFLHNPENAQREDFSTIATQHLKERKAEYLKQAPSRRASQMFSQSADGFYTSHLPGILKHTHAVKLENAKNSVEKNVATALGTFRQEAASDSVTAAHTAETQRQLYHSMIGEMFGNTITPTVERGLREYVDKQFVLGVAEQSPDYARRILGESEFINEDWRKSLGAQIDSIERRGLGVAQYRFQEQMDRAIEFAVDNRSMVTRVPKSAFLNLYGKERGEVLHAQYEDRANAADTATLVIGGMEGSNAAYISAEVSRIQETQNVPRNVKNLIAEQAKDLIRRQGQDPAGYLATHNAETHSALTAFTAQQTPENYENYVDLLWHYQGTPPEGTPPEERRKYLSLESHQRHILTADEAEQKAATLREGTPSEQLQALQQMEAQFPSKRHWAQAYNDLVTLPPQGKGIPQEMQLAFLIDDPTIQKQFMVAISNAEGLKGLATETKSEFEAFLRSNPTWQKFSRTMIGDMVGAANLVEGYKNGILKYAYALQFGRSAKDAVKLSVEHVIENQMWHTDVNGQTLMIPRKREQVMGPSLPDRTTEEISDMGRRLALSLKGLNTKDIKRVDEYGRSYFPNLPQTGEGSVEHEQMLRDILTSKGFFVPDADGQSVTVYVTGDNGNTFQLRDKQDQPFELYLDAVPKYSTMVPSPMQWRNIEHKQQPQKTYNILEDAYPGAWGRGSKRTNWPVTAEFFFKQVQPQKPSFKVQPGSPAAIQP